MENSNERITGTLVANNNFSITGGFNSPLVIKNLSNENKPYWMMNNLIAVDQGALQLVRNVLERCGKTEVLEELNKTCTPIEDVLKWYRENKPSEYMTGVTSDMIRDYT